MFVFHKKINSGGYLPMKELNTTRTNFKNTCTYGGEIYHSDFDTESSGTPFRRQGSFIASASPATPVSTNNACEMRKPASASPPTTPKNTHSSHNPLLSTPISPNGGHSHEQIKTQHPIHLRRLRKRQSHDRNLKHRFRAPSHLGGIHLI